MQIKQTLLTLPLIFSFALLDAQTTYLPQDDKSNILMERLEIKSRTDSFFNFSKTKPFSRQHVFSAIDHYLSGKNKNLSKVDAYNAQRVLLNNDEYMTADGRKAIISKKPILKHFYTTPANLFEVHAKDFDLIVNPAIQVTVSKESNNTETLYLNSRGATVRGRIANKIGFYTTLTDNQEKDPIYVRQLVTARKAVPGEGFYKQFKQTGYDFFDARGYFTFSATRYINIAFGYDRNFIGNGYRSFFLGDDNSNALFLKLNTRIWKVNYQNLFMELSNADNQSGDHLIGKKYAALHHLDIGVTKWMNLGLFEGVVFGRVNHFEFGYLNPIIFYRSIELQNGSFDNSVAGIDGKINLPHNVQLYGQFLLDEFVKSEFFKHNGYIGNKWALQMGLKYIDAFGIKNLDLQLEHNRVRPFTYSHYDSVANFTHYNQPLTHVLGANFKEYIAILRYQPAPKWLAEAKLVYYTQGRDSSNESYGSNIFLINIPPYRTRDFGYYIGSGWKTNVLYGSFLLSYEWKENFFLELNAVYRKQETTTPPITSANTSIITFGFRWNLPRRQFVF